MTSSLLGRGTSTPIENQRWQPSGGANRPGVDVHRLSFQLLVNFFGKHWFLSGRTAHAFVKTVEINDVIGPGLVRKGEGGGWCADP
jgi:hypothetical protein